MNSREKVLRSAARLSKRLIGLLRSRRKTLAFAESCTGGLLSSITTQHPGVSDVFLGSAVSYSNAAKAKLLGVGAATLGRFGAVSPEVAIQMAKGARRVFSSDIAVSITGIAGPSGGTRHKPVGTVHFAVASKSGVIAHHCLFRGSRRRIQAQAALRALELLDANVAAQETSQD